MEHRRPPDLRHSRAAMPLATLALIAVTLLPRQSVNQYPAIEKPLLPAVAGQVAAQPAYVPLMLHEAEAEAPAERPHIGPVAVEFPDDIDGGIKSKVPNIKFVRMDQRQQQLILDMFSGGIDALQQLDIPFPRDWLLRIAVTDGRQQLMDDTMTKQIYAEVYTEVKDGRTVSTVQLNGRVLWPGFFDPNGALLDPEQKKGLISLAAHEMGHTLGWNHTPGGTRGPLDDRLDGIGYHDAGAMRSPLPLWSNTLDYDAVVPTPNPYRHDQTKTGGGT